MGKKIQKHCVEDFNTLICQMKKQEKELRLKRRWLLGITLSRSEMSRLELLLPPQDKFVPESVLREDDLSYESIKTFVEETLGMLKETERKNYVTEEEIRLFDSPDKDTIKYIISLLDEMTNKELFSLTKILTNGSVHFLKTKKKMKNIIQEFLPRLFESHDDQSRIKLTQVKQLLTNPTQSFRTAIIDVLSRLEELSFVTLVAMHRNLRGVKGFTPKSQHNKPGRSLESLIKQIRKISMKLLQKFRDGDEPPRPLVKALSVAYLVLNPELRNVFSNVSPDIEKLQTDIMSAIKLVKAKRKVSRIELEKCILMLDPEFKQKAPEKSFRARIVLKNLLTAYLLECCNMDTIPERLLETVRFIIDISEKKSASCTGKTSGRATRALAWSHPKCGALSTPMPTCRTFSDEEVQEEVHLLLNLSAQAKQIVWNFLPENKFDKDFADAYMDDDYVEECCYDGAGGGSEFQDSISGRTRYYSNNNIDDINCQSESVGETIPVDDPKSPVSSSPAEVHSHNSRLSSADALSKISSCNGGSEKYDDDVLMENAYLTIQEACDETSMFAYSFVGHVLNGLDKLEMALHANASDPTRTMCEDGVGSVVMNALELLAPSFPIRGKEELRVFMGL
ncbi:unnamed protein product [Cuscuta epithymum]|uniref:Uncharacterized protein n=1 Tax=Cuscuta epithymum TaxID=186058 RepID=A0AAV0CXW7_9ASTE|nr:unnamed protein product [Cuscuta epithymum]CAH9088261.1 unnamed protein product [Cuscuta epithymum]CAH9122598.1 unnamed protein product [Cuscuta epithymum]